MDMFLKNYLVTGEFTVKSCKLQVLATLRALHPLTLDRGQLTRLVVQKSSFKCFGRQ